MGVGSMIVATLSAGIVIGVIMVLINE